MALPSATSHSFGFRTTCDPLCICVFARGVVLVHVVIVEVIVGMVVMVVVVVVKNWLVAGLGICSFSLVALLIKKSDKSARARAKELVG